MLEETIGILREIFLENRVAVEISERLVPRKRLGTNNKSSKVRAVSIVFIIETQMLIL